MRKKYLFIFTIFFAVLFSTSLFAGKYQGNRRRDMGSAKTTKTKVVEAIAVAIPIPLGPKKLIAVADFENKTNWSGQVNLGTGMADQLITALMNTSRFMVLERQSIEAVLNEQNFGASGRATSEGGAKIGDMNRAQILIQGAITEFEQNTTGGQGAVNIQGVTFATSQATAHVAVDVRVYDTTTGQILASKACKGTAKASGGGIGYADKDFGFMAGGEARTPLDFAVRDAITQAVDFIVLELSKVPWEGRVAMVKESEIFLNCGRTSGIMLGDRFSVFKPGEPIIDPDTGMNLGSENTLIGKIEVIKVDEKFSKATPLTGAGFARNDIVKFDGSKPPEPIVQQTTTTTTVKK